MGRPAIRGDAMSNLKSTVWIVPIAEVTATKALTEETEVGYKSGFSVRLSSDGNEPASHLGQHGWESPRIFDFMRGTGQPKIKGRTRAEVKAQTDKAFVSVNRPDRLTAKAHFDAVLVDRGLKIIEPKAS
jgi:hypothetical protein